MNLIFDLDGTIADFNSGGGMEKMFKRGFFRNLQAYPKGIETVKELQSFGFDVFILSTCLRNSYCKQEKLDWIAEHMPFVPKENIILISTGQVKVDEWEKYTQRAVTDYDFLFDDYKENLLAWQEKGGIAVKCGQVFKPQRTYKHQLIRFEGIAKILDGIFDLYSSVSTYDDVIGWRGY
jgi:phosphoglycolate phosphatase-like HAD superfamily hydrolase